MEASVHKIKDQAFVSIKESYKLSEVRRGNVVVDRVEVSVIGNVQRVDPQPNVMRFPAFTFEKRDAELAIRLEVQGKKFREALPVRSANILLRGIHSRVGKTGVDVQERTEGDLPWRSEDSPNNEAIRNVRRKNAVDIGPNHRRGKGNEDTGKIV